MIIHAEVRRVLEKLDALAVNERLDGTWSLEAANARCGEYGELVVELLLLVDRPGDLVLPPIVVVTRDPDASNDYAVFDGEAETYDIDAGYAELGDKDEFLEWAESHLGSARTYATDRRAAADYIRGTVLSYAEWKGHADVPEFIALVEATSYE